METHASVPRVRAACVTQDGKAPSALKSIGSLFIGDGGLLNQQVVVTNARKVKVLERALLGCFDAYCASCDALSLAPSAVSADKIAEKLRDLRLLA